MGSKAIASMEPLAGQPCLTPLAMRKCPRVIPVNSFDACGAVVVDPSKVTAYKHRHLFFSTWKIQE